MEVPHGTIPSSIPRLIPAAQSENETNIKLSIANVTDEVARDAISDTQTQKTTSIVGRFFKWIREGRIIRAVSKIFAKKEPQPQVPASLQNESTSTLNNQRNTQSDSSALKTNNVSIFGRFFKWVKESKISQIVSHIFAKKEPLPQVPQLQIQNNSISPNGSVPASAHKIKVMEFQAPVNANPIGSLIQNQTQQSQGGAGQSVGPQNTQKQNVMPFVIASQISVLANNLTNNSGNNNGVVKNTLLPTKPAVFCKQTGPATKPATAPSNAAASPLPRRNIPSTSMEQPKPSTPLLKRSNPPVINQQPVRPESPKPPSSTKLSLGEKWLAGQAAKADANKPKPQIQLPTQDRSSIKDALNKQLGGSTLSENTEDKDVKKINIQDGLSEEQKEGVRSLFSSMRETLENKHRNSSNPTPDASKEKILQIDIPESNGGTDSNFTPPPPSPPLPDPNWKPHKNLASKPSPKS